MTTPSDPHDGWTPEVQVEVQPGDPYRTTPSDQTEARTNAGQALCAFVLGKDVSHHVRRVVLDFVPRIEREAATPAPSVEAADAAWENAAYSRSRAHGVHASDHDDCAEYVVGACLAAAIRGAAPDTTALDVERGYTVIVSSIPALYRAWRDGPNDTAARFDRMLLDAAIEWVVAYQRAQGREPDDFSEYAALRESPENGEGET